MAHTAGQYAGAETVGITATLDSDDWGTVVRVEIERVNLAGTVLGNISVVPPR